MPQRPIHEYWKDRIFHHAAQGEGLGATHRLLVGESANLEPHLRVEYGPAPSVRSIARIRLSDWDPKSKEEKDLYREFYYPEAMEHSQLPWEASAACLELLGRVFIGAATGLGEKRPTIRLARAFWRITLAAPDLSARKRVRFARMWSAWEALGSNSNQQDRRNLESYLAYGPWRSEAAAAAAEKAHNAGEFDINVGLSIGPGDYDDDNLLEVLTESTGVPGLAEATLDSMNRQEEEKAEAMRLHGEGVRIEEIAERLDLRLSRVARWIGE